MPITNVNFKIASYNASKQNITAYIGLDANNKLVLKSALGNTTTWALIPNLVDGSTTAGFTLYNAGGTGSSLCADTPSPGNQIVLGDDPTPYNAASYCWTLWPTNFWKDGNAQLWTIQDNQRAGLMDAENSGTADGTRVIFWGGWNGGDNQQWIITPA